MKSVAVAALIVLPVATVIVGTVLPLQWALGLVTLSVLGATSYTVFSAQRSLSFQRNRLADLGNRNRLGFETTHRALRDLEASRSRAHRETQRKLNKLEIHQHLNLRATKDSEGARARLADKSQLELRKMRAETVECLELLEQLRDKLAIAAVGQEQARTSLHHLHRSLSAHITKTELMMAVLHEGSLAARQESDHRDRVMARVYSAGE